MNSRGRAVAPLSPRAGPAGRRAPADPRGAAVALGTRADIGDWSLPAVTHKHNFGVLQPTTGVVRLYALRFVVFREKIRHTIHSSALGPASAISRLTL